MRLRMTAALLATALAVGLGGCERQVSEVPDEERPTPEETPYLEPASPPAEDVEQPEGGNEAESDDGGQTGGADESGQTGDGDG